jgi:hypothetical protein
MKPRKLYKIILTINHIVKTFHYLKNFDRQLYLEHRKSLCEDYHRLTAEVGILENMHLRLRLKI